MGEDLWIYASALGGGYVCLADLIAWADQQVLQLDSPPGWLLDLSLAKTKEEASGTLLMEWNRYMETTGTEWPEPTRHDDLYLGFLYMRFERGDLTIAELLKLAGDYSDAHGYSIDCETFYYMLNEIDGGGPTLPSNEPLENRASRLFAPMAEFANQHLGKLPATASRAP